MKHIAFTGPLAWTPVVGLALAGYGLLRLARWIAHAEVHAELGDDG